MFFRKAIIHWRRPTEETQAFLDPSKFNELYLCDFTTMSVLEEDREFGNRPFKSGDYLGVSTAGGVEPICDGYVFTPLYKDELLLSAGRFINFDSACYSNRVSITVEVMNSFGDLVNKDILRPFIDWFHDRTHGTADKWNLSIDFNRSPENLSVKVVFTFFTTNPELAVLLYLEQAC